VFIAAALLVVIAVIAIPDRAREGAPAPA
jgi:hypothetical protein